MSMHSYPIICKGAFFIDEEVAAHIALALDKRAGKVPDEIQQLLQTDRFNILARKGELSVSGGDYPYVDMDELIDDCGGYVCYTGQFEGEVSASIPKLAKEPIEKNFCGETIFYIQPARAPELFEVAYPTKEELLEEYEHILDRLGVVMPEDFDWWGHIADIEGTYFC